MVKCVSIFTGAGGLDVGARSAGVKIIACIENDADSVETLRLNCGPDHSPEIFHTDIQVVDFTQFRDNEPTILIGGPPCQPFSKNSYWVKNTNRLIDEDPRNMIGQFLRATAELRPCGFLFENVESILHPTNLATFEKFLSEARGMGYACTVFRANSAAFGIPQKRKRIFVFGVLNANSEIPQPEPSHCDPYKPDLLGGLQPYIGVASFISKFSSDEFYEPEEVASGGNYYYELTHVPPGKNYIALSKLNNYDGRKFRSGGRFWNFLYKIHPNEPSITIAAQPGPWVGPFHWDNRRLRVPEVAAIQTFPDRYSFSGNRRSIQKQIGNAVPCLLAEKMVSHLVEHL